MISKIFSTQSNKKAKILALLKNMAFSMLFALCFSMPIYINILPYYFNELMPYSPYLNSLLALLAIFTYINIHKRFRFFFGFFSGILWFYWTGLSFRFTDMAYFGYIAVIFIASVYGILFVFLLFFQNKLFRIFSISIVGGVSILGFNWFVPDAILAFSIFKVDKISFIVLCIIIAICSIKELKKARFLALLPLIFLIDIKSKEIESPLNFYLAQTHVNQQSKWGDFSNITKANFALIQKAIDDGYEAIILPETAFPLNINKTFETLGWLNILSEKIIIITGGVRESEKKYYNSTYVFDKGKMSYADKVFLAPFGEYMPVPRIFVSIFNQLSRVNYDTTFNTSSLTPNNLNIRGITFRNAICYEATTKAAYANNPKYMIVTTNNAWFYPSIEPILQTMLIKYYARLHNTTIFYSANGSTSGVITPYTSLKLLSYAYNRLK